MGSGRRRSDIVSGNINPPLSGELPGALFVFHRGHYLLRLKYFGLEECLEQNAAHFSGSENRYPEAVKRRSGYVCTHRISLWLFLRLLLRGRGRNPGVDPLLHQIEGQSAGIQ